MVVIRSACRTGPHLTVFGSYSYWKPGADPRSRIIAILARPMNPDPLLAEAAFAEPPATHSVRGRQSGGEGAKVSTGDSVHVQVPTTQYTLRALTLGDFSVPGGSCRDL